MIQKLVEAKFDRLQVLHVRLAFSREMDDIGKFQFSKILNLFCVICQIIYMRFRHNVRILYYPPAGPNRIPLYRDLAILLSTRWLFKHTIFHFHAGGVSELYCELPLLLRFFFRLAYFGVEGAIRLSELTPPDGRNLEAKSEFIIYNGIEDHYISYEGRRSRNTVCEILFTGVICEPKGVLVLLEACNLLRQRGIDFRLKLMGKFQTERFEVTVREYVVHHGLERQVTFLGVRTADKKWEAFANADVFCFPSFFESEALPVVVLEAMQFALPVVATRWRGIPSLVRDGETGYLVPIRDSSSVADMLQKLIQDPVLAKRLGERGREVYLQDFMVEKHLKSMQDMFLSVSNG